MIVQPIENPETIDKCPNHTSNNIKLITLQKGVKAINQIYCSICLEAKSITAQTLTWNDAKKQIQQDCQERQNSLQNSLKSIIEYMKTFSKIITQMKKSFNLSFDQIITSISAWQESVKQEIHQASKYSLYDQLEQLINQENYQINSQIKEYNKKVLQVLQEEFIKLQPQKELQQLQETIIKIEIYMKKDLFEQNVRNIKCYCAIHKNEIITMINVNEGIQRDQRALCNECKLTNVITLQKFEQDWRTYVNQLELKRQEKQKELEQCIMKQKSKLRKLQQDFAKEIQKINQLIDIQMRNWVGYIKQNRIHKKGANNLQQLQLMADILSQGNQTTQEERLIDQQNIQLNTKVLNYLKQMSNILNLNIQVANFQTNEIVQQPKQEEDNLRNRMLIQEIPVIKNEIPKKVAPQVVNKQSIELISSIQQTEKCYSIAFNQNGTIMVSSSDKDIRIWEFDNGQLKDTNILLEGHTAWVYSLVFSKTINWFASASEDKTIRCWQQTSPKVWVSSEPEQIHTQSVLQILLNNKENQLISCGQDKTIKVWRLSCSNNELKFEYSLERHTQSVYCINFNHSQTQFVSVSLDKQIIVWALGNQNKWEFNQIIKKSEDDYGFRACFLNDNIISWQQQSKGFIHFFELKRGTFVERSDLRLTLRTACFDNRLFPSIFNRQKSILIQKHNQFIYIVKQEKNGKYQIIQQPLDEDSQYNYGGVTENGEYLVIKNESRKQLKVYKIQTSDF